MPALTVAATATVLTIEGGATGPRYRVLSSVDSAFLLPQRHSKWRDQALPSYGSVNSQLHTGSCWPNSRIRLRVAGCPSTRARVAPSPACARPLCVVPLKPFPLRKSNGNGNGCDSHTPVAFSFPAKRDQHLIRRRTSQSAVPH